MSLKKQTNKQAKTIKIKVKKTQAILKVKKAISQLLSNDLYRIEKIWLK